MSAFLSWKKKPTTRRFRMVLSIAQSDVNGWSRVRYLALVCGIMLLRWAILEHEPKHSWGNALITVLHFLMENIQEGVCSVCGNVIHPAGCDGEFAHLLQRDDYNHPTGALF